MTDDPVTLRGDDETELRSDLGEVTQPRHHRFAPQDGTTSSVLFIFVSCFYLFYLIRVDLII